jgi:DNA-binding HxlR family transcriptional regulator
MAEGRRGARPANGTEKGKAPGRAVAVPDIDMCPRVETAFELLSRKWAGLLIHVLSAGPRHFSELRAAIPGVSARMLAARMKDLELAGLLRREVQTASPVRVLYTLTEKGRALIPVMAGIAGWARAWVRE